MATAPDNETTVNAIFHGIAAYNVRGGETFPLQGVATKLLNKGFKAEEINNALSSMVERGWLEVSGSPLARLTKLGYEAMPD